MEWQGDLPQDHAFVELLPPGVPSEGDLQQLLRDTEDKLKLNACSIEQSVKELQVKMGESWMGERSPSPTECLQWFSPRNPAMARPVATGHQELLDFLKALLLYLSSEEEGREDATLQLLLSLSSQCGVAFPNTATAQAPPVNLLRDDSALEVQEAWDDVRSRLRRHILGRLSPRGPWSFGVAQRIQALQQLCFLLPEAEALGLYQGLRSQAVLGRLRAALAPVPGGATGFSRLEEGLRRAAPPLTRALGEELHVLNGVAEPHAILGFLNAAYLGTLARELEAVMERECETALQENTAPRSKARRISARAKASVAPLEPPRTARTFSLTSHQLGALTGLAATLLELESRVEEMATDLAFINCAGETVRGILKKTREDLDITTTDLHTHSSEAIVLEFDWRAAFRGLVPQLAHCIKVVLNDVSTKSLQQEEVLHTSGHAPISLNPTPERHDSSYTSESEAPKMVAKFSVDIMQQLDALLPLALACRDAPLLEVRCSFVEACSRASWAVLARLEERAADVPSTAPLGNLPGLLATCAFVHQRLCHYEARLKETSAGAARAPLTLLPLQRYQEATDAFRGQLTAYCVQVCVTSILHDAESHHWGDPKPFHEGERCSFSVQMWYYFLSGLRSDLWVVLPAALARDVLGRVTCDTLQVLAQRYSRVRPSYRRHLQIRCDITVLLLCVEQLMWSVCDGPEALVRSEPSRGGWAPIIHSLCEQLLAVLVVVTAPLPLLHATFRSSPAEGQRSAPLLPQAAGSTGILWLNAINPALFSEQASRGGLTGEAASLCQLRLLTSDPGGSPRLLLHALLHRDCHLPRLLLEHSYLGAEGDVDVSPEDGASGDGFMEALFHVFLSLNSAPKALTLALEPYLDRAHIWELLYNLADLARPAPVLVSCVRAVVNKPVHSLLRQLVPMVMAWQASDESSGPQVRRDVPDSVLAKVPKEWNYNSQDPRGRESTKSVVTQTLQALSFVFTNLPSAVASLPLPLRYLFQTAEKHLTQHGRQLRPLGLLPWALLSSLCQGLDDPGAPEQPVGPGARETLALLSECLQAAMGQQRGVPKPSVHKVLQALEGRRPKWTTLQLQRARKLCSESVFERGENGVAQERGAASELTEQKIGLMLLEVCHKPGGAEYLRLIYHIIQVNEELLIRTMSPPGAGPVDSPQTVNFAPATSGHLIPPPFNPLTQFDRIGRNKFDQASMADWPWDWARLLPAFQGMSQVTLKTLLANRWEMQDPTALEEEEKVLLEELQRTYFHPSPESPGPSPAPAQP